MFDKISSTRVKSFLKHENYTPLNVKGNELTNDNNIINKFQSVDNIDHHGLGYYFREKGIFERDPSDTKTDKLEYLYGTEAVESCIKSNFRNKISLYVSQDSFLNRSHYSKDIITKQQRIEYYAKEKNIQIVKLSNDKLNQFSGQRDHEGVILKVNRKEYYHIKKPELFFKSIIKHESNLFIILDQITDPQNFGSIMRSSYLLGADCVLVNKSNKPPFSPAIAKVSSGVSEAIPVMTIKFIKLFLEEAMNLNYKVITTYVNDQKYPSLDVNKLKLSKGENVIIIFGSEGLGISEILKSSMNINVKIPGMNNDRLVDSLNVGVSAGILIHKIASLIK